MKKIILISFVSLLSCARPFYTKAKHFNCENHEFKMDSDLKELVYKTLEHAYVLKKDIPDYKLIWNKNNIYISKKYELNNTVKYFNINQIPSNINTINFCIKSKTELQNIANKAREDFLYQTIRFIKIEDNKAIISIDNSWMVNKHSKKIYLSGGGYNCEFKRNNGHWIFVKIISKWIS